MRQGLLNFPSPTLLLHHHHHLARLFRSTVERFVPQIQHVNENSRSSQARARSWKRTVTRFLLAASFCRRTSVCLDGPLVLILPYAPPDPTRPPPLLPGQSAEGRPAPDLQRERCLAQSGVPPRAERRTVPTIPLSRRRSISTFSASKENGVWKPEKGRPTPSDPLVLLPNPKFRVQET